MEPADDNSGHSTSRHQPNPQILSHDQIFRAQVGETLVLPCQVAALGKKFDNLQYNMLGRWDAGPNDSSTKRLMFHVLFFFHNLLQKSLQKLFQFIFLFFL